MDKIIVYVDDADHAQQLLAPLVANEPAHQRHWVLVACAPRMTHRVSKWVSHSARESWRNKWADKLFAQIIPGAGYQPGHMGQGHGLDVDTAAIRVAPQNQQLGDLPDRKAGLKHCGD